MNKNLPPGLDFELHALVFFFNRRTCTHWVCLWINGTMCACVEDRRHSEHIFGVWLYTALFFYQQSLFIYQDNTPFLSPRTKGDGTSAQDSTANVVI